MKKITIETELGKVNFQPVPRLSKRTIEKIENSIKRVVREIDEEKYDTAEKVHAMLKKMDPLSGTPAAAITAYRFRLDMTQKQLAKKTGIPQPHISAMEKGKRPITLKTAKKIGKALKIDYHKFI